MTKQISDNQSGNATQITTTPITSKSIALYKMTIDQPEDSNSDFIHMDSDVYNIGEVIDFSLVTSGQVNLPKDCDITSFRVFLRSIDGSWKELPGPIKAYISYRAPQPASTEYPGLGPSIPEYRLVTTRWVAGYY